MFVYHECLRETTVTTTIEYLDKNYDEKCYKYEKRLLAPATNALGGFMMEAINAFCKEYQRLEVNSIVQITIKEVEDNDDDSPTPRIWYFGGYN